MKRRTNLVTAIELLSICEELVEVYGHNTMGFPRGKLLCRADRIIARAKASGIQSKHNKKRGRL